MYRQRTNRSWSIDLSLNLVDFTFDQLEFEFTHELTVIAVHPTSGHASGGSLVTISGRGFREGVECRFGSKSVPAVFLENSDGITERCFDRAESVEMPTGNVYIPRHVKTQQCVGWSVIGCEAPATSIGWTALEVRSSEASWRPCSGLNSALISRFSRRCRHSVLFLEGPSCISPRVTSSITMTRYARLEPDLHRARRLCPPRSSGANRWIMRRASWVWL